MKLSTRVRYALWLMLEIAREHQQLKVSLQDISQKTNISRRYLEQLVISLKNAGLLLGQAGRRGGYKLTRPADQVRIREIIEAVNGPVNVVECVCVPDSCLKSEVCECRWLYATINEKVTRVLDQLTLADLIDETHPDKLCRGGTGEFAACPTPPQSQVKTITES